MLLNVEKLKLEFPANQFVAVDEISFSIETGEILALVGESGSGKSLTALSLMALQPNTAKLSGNIYFQGDQLMSAGEYRADIHKYRGKKIAYIPQDPLSSLNPVYRISNQLSEAVAVHDKTISSSEITKKSLDYLAKVGIPDPERAMQAYPHELSGGMRQRVMIAMAVINDPDLLIADEPTTALDVTVQALILKLLKELNKTILFITHDLAVVAEIADRVIVMQNGKIIEENDVFSLYENPREDYTKSLLMQP